MKRVSRKKSTLKGGDRISRLPDEILCYILSFIPTIDSVITCVLSKRWEHLWEYVPKLNFDDFFLHPVQRERFANSVNSILSLHISKVTVLEKLFLRCRQINEVYDITKWVSSSIIRNIQSLDLNIIVDHSKPLFQLPSCMFSCKTLESLMLEGNIWIIVPSHVCLPRLGTLKLSRLVYKEHANGSLILTSSSLESIVIEQTTDEGHLIIGSNPQMLSSTLRHIKLIKRFDPKNVMVPVNVFTFRVLEKLILRGSFIICALPATICMPNLTFLELVQVQYQDHEIFSTLISSCTSLESLNVENSMEVAELNISSCTLKTIELKLISGSNPGHKLVINAPALKYLKLNIIRGMIDYQIEDLPSLEQAVVTIKFDRGISHDYCSSSLMNIYQALQHVKSLKVKHSFPKGCGFGHALPTFTRLTELDINIYSRKCGVLLEFIINSAKLENLTLNGLCGVSWRNPNNVPACLLTSLRSVLIISFRGGAGVTLMAEYFIKNAKILEKMKILFDPNSHKKKVRVSKKIFNFGLASHKCVVSIK